jgi:hypothetical protein
MHNYYCIADFLFVLIIYLQNFEEELGVINSSVLLVADPGDTAGFIVT